MDFIEHQQSDENIPIWYEMDQKELRKIRRPMNEENIIVASILGSFTIVVAVFAVLLKFL